MVVSELGPVIESDGSPQCWRHRGQQLGELLSHGIGCLIGLTRDKEKTRTSFMSHQYGLSILGKQHQVRFPMTRLAALVDVGRALIDRNAPLDVVNRTATFVL